MTPVTSDTAPGASTNWPEGRRGGPQRLRGRFAPKTSLAEREIPIWWPELAGLVLEVRRTEKVLETARIRRDLALWFVSRVRGIGPTWLGKRLGVSRMRINQLAQRGEDYATARGLSAEDVAALLFTKAERISARDDLVRRRRARLERDLEWWSAPPPPPGLRDLPPPAERGWHEPPTRQGRLQLPEENLTLDAPVEER